MEIKTYSKLITLKSFEERFEYLKTNSSVGSETFGYDRYMNQMFYRSKEWKDFRNYIIVRDNGCDLAIEDRQLFDELVIHHIVPITVDDIKNSSIDILLNPDNVILTCPKTHRAIHYGDLTMMTPSRIVERTPNDTCPWKR